MGAKSRVSSPKPDGSARERLLAAATELFYAEGIHTVGIDRVIERAGVAKASLYSTFGSKDELVRAYLDGRGQARRKRITERLARYEHPRAKLLGLFDLMEEQAADPAYRGCAFVNASAEGPRDETTVSAVCDGWRSWLRWLLTDLARACSVSDPDAVGRQLQVLYDGAMVSAAMDHDPSVARDAREVAALLLDAARPVGAPR